MSLSPRNSSAPRLKNHRELVVSPYPRFSNGRPSATVSRRGVWLFIAMFCAASVSGASPPPEQEHPTGEIERPSGFRWGTALQQSFFFLSIEHSLRLTQAKTRNEFQGKFFNDYWSCVKNIRGWDDGDGLFTNYIAHPMQGGWPVSSRFRTIPAALLVS